MCCVLANFFKSTMGRNMESIRRLLYIKEGIKKTGFTVLDLWCHDISHLDFVNVTQ